MNTKHTPGPWSVDKPFMEKGTYVKAKTSALICKLYPVDNEYVGDKKTSVEANARLIAAAPELLEACKLVLRLEKMVISPRVTETLCNAIAKAEGR